MFTSWVKACKTTAGFSEAVDTRKEHPDLSDKMVSTGILAVRGSG